MSLRFDGGATHSVNFGSAASLDDIDPLTVCMWMRFDNDPASGGIEVHMAKSTSSLLLYSYQGGGTVGLEMARIRSTTNMQVTASWSNFANMGSAKHIFVCAQHSSTGAATDQKLLVGDQDSPPAEPSSYILQRTGVGTLVSDASSNMIFGGTGSTWNLDGTISWVGVYNKLLSTAEIFQQWRQPKTGMNCVLFAHLGLAGTGTQNDLSGNGNNGTVTSATKDTHAPINLYPRPQRIWWKEAAAAAAGQPITKRHGGFMPTGAARIGRGWR